MRTVVLGERPAELQALIDRRRALGLDGHDEVWEGEYHVAPYAHSRHGLVESELTLALGPRARRRGWRATGPFNLGAPDDFRVPDGGVHRRPPGTLYVHTAALVVEVLSPDDETFDKFGFYAVHAVDELVVADPLTRTVRCWHLSGAGYDEQPGSALLEVDTATLVAEIDWP